MSESFFEFPLTIISSDKGRILYRDCVFPSGRLG